MQIENIKICCSYGKDAASKGHLDCLKKYHQNGENLDYQYYLCAASGGNIECLEYLYDNNCSRININNWSGNPYDFAGQENHIHVIKWLYEHDFDLKIASMTRTRMKKNFECVEYIENKKQKHLQKENQQREQLEKEIEKKQFEQLRKKIKQENIDNECKICFNVYNIKKIFIPCGHCCVCNDCINQIQMTTQTLNCPFCRKKIDKVINLHET
jgi:hypothetical protein